MGSEENSIPTPEHPASYLQGAVDMANAFDSVMQERGLQLMLEAETRPLREGDEMPPAEKPNFYRRAGEIAISEELKKQFEFVLARARSIQES